jgi:hypothetical protein
MKWTGLIVLMVSGLALIPRPLLPMLREGEKTSKSLLPGTPVGGRGGWERD